MPAVTEAARGKGCVSSVRESQGTLGSSGSRVHRADRGAVRFVEGLMVEAGVTGGVDVVVVVASSRCAGRC